MGWRVEVVGAVALASTATACGPGTDPERPRTRPLLIEDRSTGAGMPTLVWRDGERRSLPFDDDVDLSAFVSTQWARDGEALVVVDSTRSTWRWTDGEPEPSLLHGARAGDDVGRAEVESNGRYVKAWSGVSGPSYSSRTVLYDLETDETLLTVDTCGSGGQVQWHDGGPSAVMVSSPCPIPVDAIERSLVHVAPEGTTVLATYPPGQTPSVVMAPRGDLAFVGHADRWQLMDVRRGAILHEAPQPSSIDLYWSFDGRSIYVLEDGKILSHYDEGGAERWRVDYGIGAVSVTPSPVDGRVLVMTADCLGGSCVSIVQEDGTRSFGETPRWGATEWHPRGDMLLVGPSDPESGSELWDLEARESLALGVDCRRPEWSPDGEVLVCADGCEPDPEGITPDVVRLLLFDRRAERLAEIPCGHQWGLVWSPDSDVFAVNLRPSGSEPQDDEVVLFDRDGGRTELGLGVIASAGWRPGVE